MTVSKYAASLIQIEYWIHTGIPEFVGTVLNEERFDWDDEVTDMLMSIPEAIEVESYGEYSVKLMFRETEEIPDDVVAYVQRFIDHWVPSIDPETNTYKGLEEK